jgi:hypothetical protein
MVAKHQVLSHQKQQRSNLAVRLHQVNSYIVGALVQALGEALLPDPNVHG